MESTHVNVRDLPARLQSALSAAGYRARDIAIAAHDTFVMEKSYGDGFRAFTIVLNLETGESRRYDGSWGGANPFETRRTEIDESEHPIPANGCAILGQFASKVRARVVVRPDQIAKYLPAPAETTDRERSLLAIFGGIKAGTYRATALADAKATLEEIAALEARGFLKVAKGGATTITTAGKNARGNARVW